MFTHRTFPLALIGLLTALPVTAQDNAQDTAKKHLLRYRFQKGKTGHFTAAQKAEMNMTFGEQSVDTDMDIETFMELHVADVVDGAAQMQSKISRLKMKMQNPMSGNVEFDTAEEDSVPAMFDSLLDVIGQTIELSVDDRGRSKDVKLPDALKQMAQRGMDLEQMLGQFMAQLPEEPVALGDTWQTTMTQKLGQGGDVVMQVENKLLAVEGDDTTIGMSIKMDLSGPELPQKISIEDGKAQIVMDMSTGLPKGMDMSMKMNMAMEQGDMKMDMKMKMEMTIKPAAPPAAEKGEKTEKSDKK